jgi:hypothetical protein
MMQGLIIEVVLSFINDGYAVIYGDGTSGN